MQGSSRLVLAHFWAAFAAFAVAIPLGAWQMLVRSPLHRWVDPELYYRAVTAHGTTFAYVFPTLIAMGFGYAVCAVSLGRPMHGLPLAWLSFVLVMAGAAMALATVAAGKATVLYTFYPPLLGSPYYYLGILIAVVGSWIWVGLMVWHFRRWKLDHPGLPVPLAMFATTVGALLWGWTSLGAGAEIAFLILPNAFGWTSTIDPGLARVLFSWTLHAIVYFWLIPDLHRVLRLAAAGRRRPPVQRQDGSHRVPAAPRLLDADRHSSFVCRSPDRGGLQVSSCRVHRNGRGANPAHDLHDLRLA